MDRTALAKISALASLAFCSHGTLFAQGDPSAQSSSPVIVQSPDAANPQGQLIIKQGPGGSAQMMPQMMAPPAGAATGDHADLPMTFRNGFPTLQVTINGKGPFAVGFDTGAMGGPHMSEATIAALGLHPFDEAQATDPSGKNPVAMKLYHVDHTQLGSVTLQNLIGSDSVLKNKKTEGLGAIIGLGGFDGLVVTLDYAHGRFTADRGELPPADGKNVFSYDGPVPTAPLVIEGHTLEAHLDTGNIRQGVIVPKEFAETLSKKAEAKSIGVAHTISSTVQMFAVPVAAPVTMAGAPLPVSDVAYPAIAREGNVGSLGLKDMIVRIDPLNKRFQLVPATAATALAPIGATHPGQMLMQQAPGGPPKRMMGPGKPEPFPEAKEIAPPTNDKELAADIEKLGDEVGKAGQFSGSVLVAVNGKPLLKAAWGEADRNAKVPNTAETAYDIGSIGKLCTQIAIIQLVEAGKISLDDAMGKYLPDYPDRAIAAKVTVRELLEHSSGIPDFFSRVTPETKIDAMVDLKDFLPLFAREPLDFEPGSSKQYSNSGYIVLGLIIEATSGEDYRGYVQRHILDLAGMKHSGFFDRKNLPPFVARSYEGSEDVTNQHARRGSSAGGMQATASDLLRLVQAINEGKLIKPASISELRGFIPRPPDAPPPAENNKLVAYGISGGGPGVGAELAIDPTGRYTRVVLSNGGPPMTMSMGATIRAWINNLPKGR